LVLLIQVIVPLFSPVSECVAYPQGTVKEQKYYNNFER